MRHRNLFVLFVILFSIQLAGGCPQTGDDDDDDLTEACPDAGSARFAVDGTGYTACTVPENLGGGFIVGDDGLMSAIWTDFDEGVQLDIIEVPTAVIDEGVALTMDDLGGDFELIVTVNGTVHVADHVTLTFDRFDGVGGRAEGTFEADCTSMIGPTVAIEVTDGQFDVAVIADTPIS